MCLHAPCFLISPASNVLEHCLSSLAYSCLHFKIARPTFLHAKFLHDAGDVSTLLEKICKISLNLSTGAGHRSFRYI
jgi:hypothetical protein